VIARRPRPSRGAMIRIAVDRTTEEGKLTT
jgi:hypothetical protein